MLKPIFIGGLGRSGTTICLNALYNHRDVYAVPVESKFLVEEEGFHDLIRALTSDFAPGYTAHAYHRFVHLMREQVTGKVESKFLLQKRTPASVFETYEEALDRFLAFIGDQRAFGDRGPLIAATQIFLDETFAHAARQACKEIWVEKTPSNIFRVNFLRELYPSCYIVHMMRHPVDIYNSYMEKGWLSADRASSMRSFVSYCDALAQVRRQYLDDPLFIEVRLEDLVAKPTETLGYLAERLGISFFEKQEIEKTVSNITGYYANKNSGGRAIIPNDEIEILREALTHRIGDLGYE